MSLESTCFLVCLNQLSWPNNKQTATLPVSPLILNTICQCLSSLKLSCHNQLIYRLVSIHPLSVNAYAVQDHFGAAACPSFNLLLDQDKVDNDKKNGEN